MAYCNIYITLILINANLLILSTFDIIRLRRTIVTWICFLRVSDQTVFAKTASKCRIALHGEHAEDRDIFVLLFRPFDSLLTHCLRLQMQLARQPLTQRVGGHIFFQNVYTNKHACIHRLPRSLRETRNRKTFARLFIRRSATTAIRSDL